MKFAAIDIGSNAVKLLLARVLDTDTVPYFKKESFVRMPIRLGDDVFSTRRISQGKAEALVKTMDGFRLLIDAYGAIEYMACATSAMRDAENGEEIAAEIRRVTGIELQIVDGAREAQIIYSNHAENAFDSEGVSLYVDVGGGSTEVSFMKKGVCLDSRSFQIGTIRILQGQIAADDWKPMRTWLKETVNGSGSPVIIGSGGNINKVFRLARKKDGKPLTQKKLTTIYEMLTGFSYDQRIRLLGLRPDRADVIVPACEIFLSIMKWTGSDTLYVPQIGLSDGLVHILYERTLLQQGVRPEPTGAAGAETVVEDYPEASETAAGPVTD